MIIISQGPNHDLRRWSNFWLCGVAEDGEEGRESKVTSLMFSSPEFSDRRSSKGGRLPESVLMRGLPHFSSVPSRWSWLIAKAWCSGSRHPAPVGRGQRAQGPCSGKYGCRHESRRREPFPGHLQAEQGILLLCSDKGQWGQDRW